jgi:hypothetical protein
MSYNERHTSTSFGSFLLGGEGGTEVWWGDLMRGGRLFAELFKKLSVIDTASEFS